MGVTRHWSFAMSASTFDLLLLGCARTIAMSTRSQLVCRDWVRRQVFGGRSGLRRTRVGDAERTYLSSSLDAKFAASRDAETYELNHAGACW